MRKVFIILISVALGVIGCSVILLHNTKKTPSISDFILADYAWEIETFPSDKNVGKVNDYNKAVNEAKKLWIESFRSKSYNPINGKKILVFYDSLNECWLIKGTLAPHLDGAVPHTLITSEGKVLAVWMG